MGPSNGCEAGISVDIPLRHSRRALRSKVSSGRGDGRVLLGETPGDVVIAPPATLGC